MAKTHPECKHTPDFVRAVLYGDSTRGDKEALLTHCMDCIPCLDVFKAAVKEKQERVALTDQELIELLKGIKDPNCILGGKRLEALRGDRAMLRKLLQGVLSQAASRNLSFEDVGEIEKAINQTGDPEECPVCKGYGKTLDGDGGSHNCTKCHGIGHVHDQ